MENNFNFINFSFFEIDSLTAMKEAVREVYIREEYKRYRVFRTDQQSPRNIGPDSAGRKMVDMSEIYKNN